MTLVNHIFFTCLILLCPLKSVSFPIYPVKPIGERTRLAVSKRLQEALEYVETEILRQSNESDKSILDRISIQHELDVLDARRLAVERDQAIENPVLFERIHVGEYPLALRSIAEVLNESDRSILIDSAETVWQDEDKRKSRFTYGDNYEVHVTDLSSEARDIFNRMMTESIYPLIREAFGWGGGDLCVYDSLIIRYNATESKRNGKEGAGQPLHRDLGLYSINIMLNSKSEFEGGGTFFENQLRSDADLLPVRPDGPGYLIAHSSQERHAGASTTDGVRDILVIFVISTDNNSLGERLKQTREACAHLSGTDALCCRIQRCYLALQEDEADGEAMLYLGSALIEYADVCHLSSAGSDLIPLTKALKFLNESVERNPCDSRGWNNMGLTLSRLNERHSIAEADDVVFSLENAVRILERSGRAGCEVELELDAARLNLGLLLSKMDRFQEASRVLKKTALKMSDDSRLVRDARSLMEFCERQSSTCI